MKVKIEIELSDTDYKVLENVAYSPQEWVENFVNNRILHGKKQILEQLYAHCNRKGIAAAIGEDAQIQQAYDLGVVKTGAQQQAESDAEKAARESESEL